MSIGSFLAQFDGSLIERAYQFFESMLEIEDSEIPIELKLVDNLGRGHTAGVCQPKFKDGNLESISIQIKNQGTSIGMIEALAHEMVHAKQIIKGESTVEITYSKLFGFIKVPKATKFWKGQDVTGLSYYEQPAEIEAHMMQKYLTFTFLNIYKEKFEPDNMFKLMLSLKVDKLTETARALADSIITTDEEV